MALAVLVASGVASAQSTVTLYGIADAWIGHEKTFDALAGTQGISQTRLGSGGIGESRFGFKGSEDLGGDLKVNFLLESGVSLNTGETGAYVNPFTGVESNVLFSRQAYIGFSAGFGEVRMGKTFTAYDDISGASNAAFDSALSPQNNVWKSGNYSANPGSAVYYASPGLSGFSGAASYSFGENKDTPAVGVSAGKIVGFHVKYEGGPVYAGLAYQAEKATAATPAQKYTRLNASYDLGVAKLLAGYGRVAEAANRTTDWQIGADFPVTSSLTVSGGYARSRDNAAAGGARRTGLGLAASYSLSARTSLYGGLQASKQTRAAMDDLKGCLYAVGVRHTF